MPPIITCLVALSVLGLTPVVQAQTNACPPGEKQVCLNGCICLPYLGQVPDGVYQVGAPALALWLTQARAEAASAEIQPIPPHIREQLLRWYDPSVLDAAHYKVSDNGQFSAATSMLQNPDVGELAVVAHFVVRGIEDAGVVPAQQ